MSIVADDTELNIDGLFEQTHLVHICGGLVVINELSQTVRFVHYTVQEHLETNLEILGATAIHARMAKTCLTYLSYSAFDKQPPRDGSGRPNKSVHKFFVDLWTVNPLYLYAAINWGYHTKLSYEDNSVLDKICRFSTLRHQMELAIDTYFHDQRGMDYLYGGGVRGYYLVSGRP